MNPKGKKLLDVPGLPRGWKREECIMTHGLSTGKVAVRYYGPTGKRVTSKPELQRLLGDEYDLSNFDFNAGKFTHASKVRGRGAYGCPITPAHQQPPPSDVPKEYPSTMAPRELSISNLRQQVTLVKNMPGEVRDINPHSGIRPFQVFWFKRLEGVQPTVVGDVGDRRTFDLSPPMEPLKSLSDDRTAFISLARALHASKKRAYVGQTDPDNLEKLPGVYVEASEPAMKAFKITEKDVLTQEEKVNLLRKQMAELQRELGS